MRRTLLSDQRGTTDLGWLHSRHSFSFGEWHDPGRMHFRSLRVLNDDIVAPGGGFDEHPHRDMEIVTIVLEGELAHRDSLGHRQELGPGEVQVMSAGAGIRHSEFNASATHPVHFIQTWLLPRERGLAPRYAQRSFADAPAGTLICVANGGTTRAEGAIEIAQDASLWTARFAGRERAIHELARGRAAYLHVMRGEVAAGGARLGAGDALVVEDEGSITIEGLGGNADILLYDLA